MREGKREWCVGMSEGTHGGCDNCKQLQKGVKRGISEGMSRVANEGMTLGNDKGNNCRDDGKE